MSRTACGNWRMNWSTTASHFVFVLVGLLCFSVVMQILGVPCSFWDMNETGDLVETSLLEGFSLPSYETPFSVFLHESFYAPSPPLKHEILLVRTLFHPPVSYT